MQRSHTVLIVEDDSDIRELFNEIFEASNFTVSVACDGQEAMEYLKECEAKKSYPGVILLDMLMPRLSGLDVIKIVLAEYPNTLAKLPYIITSAKDHLEFKKMNLPPNFMIMKKPMDVDMLIEQSIQHSNKYSNN